MSQLESLNQELAEFFKESWWHSNGLDLGQSEEDMARQNLDRFDQALTALEESFFNKLNISIIRGEYAESLGAKTEIEKIKNLVENLSPPILEDQPPIITDYFFISGFNDGFIEPLKYAIKQYSEFLHSFELRMVHPEKEYLIKYDQYIMSMRWNDAFDENSRPNLEIFRQNLIVATCDHWLSIEDNKLNLLIEAMNILSNYSAVQAKSYTSLIKIKAEFLVAKIYLRKKKERLPNPVYSVVNGELIEIDKETIQVHELFRSWIDYAYVHYELAEDWKNKIAKYYKEIQSKNLNECSLLELHRKIKYYKDALDNSSISLSELQLAKAEIKKRFKNYTNTNCPFNKYSLSICWNYAANNEFSKSCSIESMEQSHIKQNYVSLTAIQHNANIKNFFPQTRYMKYLLAQLKKEFEAKRALQFVDKARSLIQECKEIDNDYQSNVEWSKRILNYVYQLPFSECCLSVKESEVDRLFIFSSFLLPLPKKKYIEEYHENLNKVNQYEASIRVFENVQVDLVAHENWVKESKDKETRTMEILAIFTAIIAFVAASIPSFQFITEPKQVGYFILALSTSFILFVSLFIVAIRSKLNFSSILLLLMILLFLTGFLWFAFSME